MATPMAMAWILMTYRPRSETSEAFTFSFSSAVRLAFMFPLKFQNSMTLNAYYAITDLKAKG